MTVCNDDDFFSIFAWGSSANSRTARGKIGNANALANHRMHQRENRNHGNVIPAGMVAGARDAGANVPPNVAVAAAGGLLQDENESLSDENSYGFVYEDEYYYSDDYGTWEDSKPEGKGEKRSRNF